MWTVLAKLQNALRKNRYLLAAFLIPLAVRSLPEVLSWPYPIGADTLRYIPRIQQSWVFSLGPFLFLKTTNLFYVVASLPYWLFGDAFLVIKIFGPLLLSALSVVMYFYATRVLGWSGRKSLLVSILVSTYFVSLRISWDLYKQMLGAIFLVATFVALKSFSSPRRYYVACVLMVLTVLSHELAAVTLFVVIGLEAVSYLLKKARKDFVRLLASTSLSVSLFFFQRYWPENPSIIVPVFYTASEPSVGLSLHILGLFVYLYILISPLILIGLTSLKNSILRYWTVLCVAIPILTVLYPSASLPYWNRWEYLLVYPLVFYAVEGFGRLWKSRSSSKSNLKRLVPKALVVVYLSLLLVLSGYYLTTTAENSFPYFSQYNPYLKDIPSSLLQTTISVSDTPSLVQCLEWLNRNTNETSTIVSHYALYDWLSIYVHDVRTVSTSEVGSMWTRVQTEATLADNMLDLAKEASARGYQVYTVWWINGEGWYQIPSLPPDFTEVYSAGRMAVYSYVPRV